MTQKSLTILKIEQLLNKEKKVEEEFQWHSG